MSTRLLTGFPRERKTGAGHPTLVELQADIHRKFGPGLVSTGIFSRTKGENKACPQS